MAAYYTPPTPPGTHPSHHHHPPHRPYYQSLPTQPPPPPIVILGPPPTELTVPPPVPLAQHHHILYHPSLSSSYVQLLPPPPPPPDDDVRTLFIAGLPDDVKPREIYHLFREFPGYESSNLRSSDRSQPFAFAVFSDQQSAVAAMHALNGMLFDLEKGSTLYIDLAKSNSRLKRSRTGTSRDDEGPDPDKRFKGSTGFPRVSFDTGVGSFHIPGMGNSAHNMIGYPSAQSHLSFDTRIIDPTSAAKRTRQLSPYAQQDNPPCPTLFVANLGPACTEQELYKVFSRCSGFLKLKVQGSRGAHVAFVDFQDTASSTEALGRLQGAVLQSSVDGEGMRLEYPFIPIFFSFPISHCIVAFHVFLNTKSDLLNLGWDRVRSQSKLR